VRLVRTVDPERDLMTLTLQFDVDSDPDSAADRAWELVGHALSTWQKANRSSAPEGLRA
jgi:hypothetical protein